MVPVSVIVVTKNEEEQIAACLDALRGFDDILVVDSASSDRTQDIAQASGARVVSFVWNGGYPKKRQWALDSLPLKYDWVFFVDADEIVTEDLKREIESLFMRAPECAGYFVTGRYRLGGKILRFGLPNRKIALFSKTKMEFPEVDDLDISGMGEIEGHYQPVLKNPDFKIGSLKHFLIHDALADERAWRFRHEKYARWEAGMNRKNAWPADPVPWRERVKRGLRGSRFRPELVFFIGFILRFGFLDGAEGKKLALLKYNYYNFITFLRKMEMGK